MSNEARMTKSEETNTRRRPLRSFGFHALDFFRHSAIRHSTFSEPYEVGDFSGQSFASRSASIFSCEYRRPRFIPGQRVAAWFQLSWLARFPPQNGQVRHWSGRTA